MSPNLPADRENELNLFTRMISGQVDERILLIKATGGRGKSTLLKVFVRHCAGKPHVPVDLKGRTFGLHEIFYQICDTLGWSNFDGFAAAVSNLANVTIARNTLIGRPTIQVALHADDEDSRNARRTALTQAFFDDLRALPRPPILLFDTFDATPPEVSEWFSQTFLPHAYRSPKLVVVIAGREVPVETIAWSCHLYHLPPIDDHQSWQTYCEQTGLTLHVEGVKVLCVLFKGHPDDIDKALSAVAGRGGA